MGPGDQVLKFHARLFQTAVDADVPVFGIEDDLMMPLSIIGRSVDPFKRRGA